MAMKRWRSVRATPEEKTHTLPGDELIKEPIGSLDHAITLRRARQEVWPWLAQMGAGSRAGWYSYDFLDNGRRPSAQRIIPELQKLAVGMIFPALPGATDGFTVLAFEPQHFLVLGWTTPDGARLMTWAYVLEDGEHDRRASSYGARAGPGYRFPGYRGGRRSASLRRFTSSCSGNNCLVSPDASRGAPLSRCAVPNSHESSLHSGSVLRGLRAAAGVLNTDASPIPAFA